MINDEDAVKFIELKQKINRLKKEAGIPQLEEELKNLGDKLKYDYLESTLNPETCDLIQHRLWRLQHQVQRAVQIDPATREAIKDGRIKVPGISVQKRQMLYVKKRK